VRYFTVFNDLVNSAKNNEEYVKLPISSLDNNFIFIRKNVGIKLSGDGVFATYFAKKQAVEMPVVPNATKNLTIDIITDIDESKALKAAYPNLENVDYDIYSPKQYEVFQRETKYNGKILFSGKINKEVNKLYYKIEGTGINGRKLIPTWKELKVYNNNFNEYVPCEAGGWYKVQLKFVFDNTEKIVNIDKVGIGEIIVAAGQSNTTNSGEFRTQQTSGMVVSTNGIDWKYGDDPFIGSHDENGGTNPNDANLNDGGTMYPALGDMLYNEFKVPIAIASTGHGGTCINQWQEKSELYNWFISRVYQLGVKGFRCVLWHQGESDVTTDFEEYYTKLANLIITSNKDAGWYFPWFVAKVSYLNAKEAKFENVREAHQKLWDKGIAMEGPDSDVLVGDNRDYNGEGIHFSPKGLKNLGEMFGDYIAKYIHSEID